MLEHTRSLEHVAKIKRCGAHGDFYLLGLQFRPLGRLIGQSLDSRAHRKSHGFAGGRLRSRRSLQPCNVPLPGANSNAQLVRSGQHLGGNLDGFAGR